MDLYFWIREDAKLAVFFVVYIIMLIVSCALMKISKSQKTKESRRKMISLELASPEKAKKIVDSWQGNVREDAFLNLGVDYLFLFLYPISMSLACNLLAKSFETGWVQNLGLWLSVISLFSIVLDGVENYAIIQMLKTRVFVPWANIARFSATPKFLIIIVGSLYVLIGFIYFLPTILTKIYHCLGF